MTEWPKPNKQINLCGVSCPLNFVRVRLELEKLKKNETLQVDLDRGDPEKFVISGLNDSGYAVRIMNSNSSQIRLLVSSIEE